MFVRAVYELIGGNSYGNLLFGLLFFLRDRARLRGATVDMMLCVITVRVSIQYMKHETCAICT